jgi:hypothetical protein
VPIGLFKICYFDEEGDSVTFSNEEEFIQAVGQTRTTHQQSMRLFLHLSTPTTGVSDLKEKSSTEAESLLPSSAKKATKIRETKIIDTPELEKQVEALVVQTLTSKSFIDSVVKSLVPQLINLLKENAKEKEEMETPSSGEREQVGYDKKLIEETPAVILEQVSAETPSEEATQEVKADDGETTGKNKDDGEKVNAQETNASNEESKAEDNFVMVKDTQAPHESSVPLVRSFLSLFRGLKKEEPHVQQQQQQEPEEPIPDELLQRLADMGFTDKEANLKTLRFHKKFNEGLDEVIEDLLVQSFEKKTEKKDDVNNEKQDEKKSTEKDAEEKK